MDLEPTKGDWLFAAIATTVIMSLSAFLWGKWAAPVVAFGLTAILLVLYRLLTGKWPHLW